MSTTSDTHELQPTDAAEGDAVAAVAAAAAVGATSTSSERPTLLVAIDGQALGGCGGGADSGSSVAASSPGGGSLSSVGSSPSSFLPEMPQWKKDLIQRRKSNVARTMGAAAPMTPTSPQQRPASLETAVGSGDGWPSSPTKDYSPNAATVIQMLNIADKAGTTKVHTQQQQHHHHHHSASQHNNALKSTTTTRAKTSRSGMSSSAEDLEKNAKTILTNKMPASNSPTKAGAATSPYPKPTSPYTTSSSSASSSSASSSASSTPTKRKEKRSTGGHYTPLATTSKEENVRTTDHRSGDLLAGLERQQRQHASKTTFSTTTITTPAPAPKSSPKKSPTKSTAASIPIPKQRSLFLAGGATETAPAPAKSHAKEVTEDVVGRQSPKEPVSSAITAGGRYVSEKRVVGSGAATATAARTRSTGSALVRERTAAAAATTTAAAAVAAAEMHETETTRKQLACGTYSPMQSTVYTEHGANSKAQQLLQLQSHSRNESERSSTHSSDARSSSLLLTVDIAKTVIQPTAAPTVTAVVCGGKISTKLQNNQFIKNQKTTTTTPTTLATSGSGSSGGSSGSGGGTAAGLISLKYLKYKSHSVQEVAGQNPNSATVTLSPGTSPTKPTSPGQTFGGASAIKKKMVAVQEMKKTTQSTNHLHLHHHNHHNHHAHGHAHHQRDQQMIIGGATSCHQQQQSPNGTGEDVDLVDPSEDLSYGPGIVSKLRCRYLSLALRDSIEKQRRHRIENMRRATSLNNLLDRDDHKHEEDDDDDDVDDEAEREEDDDDAIDVDVDEVARRGRAAPENGAGSKLRLGGILKHSNEPHDAAVGVAGKKTATFQASTATNGGQRMSQSQSQYGSAVSGEGGSSVTATDTPRSRHLKRGNDSLKRARSVEALLCEKSPWHFASRRSNEVNKQSPTTAGAALASPPTCVTIEDKIHNARDRLHSGTDTMPPKRLTSIIDDTERPPPDLVKQTLKLFEATANRRGRGPSRTNGKGEVANKVANYRSIIKEQKPPIVYPKPTSPTKRTGAAVKPAARPVVVPAAADLIANPLGRKTAAAAALYANASPLFPPTSAAALATSTPSKSSGAVDQSTPENGGAVGGAAAGRSKLLTEESAAVESPVSLLAKKLRKLNIDSPQSAVGGGAAAGSNTITTKEAQAKQQQQQQQQQQKRRANELAEPESREGDDDNNKLVGGDGDDAAIVAGDGVSVARVDDDDKNERGDRADGAAERTDIVRERERARAGATAASSASDRSDDDDDGLASTKRVTKTALDNIAKAGTTQQFKFSNGNSAGRGTVAQTQQQQQHHHTTTVKSNSIANGSSGIGIGSHHQLMSDSPSPSLLGSHSPSPSPHPKSPSSDIPTSVLNASPGKQIGVIRPLHTSGTPTAVSGHNNQHHHQQQHHHHQLQHHMDTLKQHPTSHSIYAGSGAATAASHIGSSSPHTPLTSREIEKNRINEMKKTAASALMADSASNTSYAASSAAAAAHATSLDTVINTNSGKASGPSSSSASALLAACAAGGSNELDAVTAKNSPLWALRKKRQAPPAVSNENTSMVFNFSNRKDVPDYIENDGVVFRRKRELPKPNESGFVLLGDLSLETSTDTDYDDFSMCPPSPCDVEFENAYIVIDGKSSIRQRPKETTLHVHFNDALTSTISYPSEASMIVDNHNAFNDRRYDGNDDDFVSAFENLMLAESDSPVHHHHVAVDEIIQLPTQHSSPATTAPTTPTKNILGNLPLGSAPLGFYTPIKAPIDSLFQLGVTRAPPNSNGHAYNATSPATATPLSAAAAAQAAADAASSATTNGNGNGVGVGGNGCGSIVSIADGVNGGGGDEPDSLQFMKPTDLLY